MADLHLETLCKEGLVCGVDEAGRGPLAGPVVAAAVIIPDDKEVIEQLNEVNDSKALSKTKREKLFTLIKETCHFGIGQADSSEIDRINILQATFEAMRRAVAQLNPQPNYALIDGNSDPSLPTTIETRTIIKGDAKSLSIAAASIIAKVTRDRIMERYHSEFPHYGWESNAGYHCKAHIDGIEQFGITPYHRHSFAPVRDRMILGKVVSQ